MQEVLSECLAYAQAVGNSTTAATCKLSLAQLEALVNGHDQALGLLEAAQQLGGDMEFWTKCMGLYGRCQLAKQDGRQTAKHALECGIEMIGQVARCASETCCKPCMCFQYLFQLFGCSCLIQLC